MSEIKNLWPEDLLKGEDLLLPVTILQEQAKYFNEMTRNLIVASIITKKVVIQSKKNPNESKPALLHTLKIQAPALGNYDFELVRLAQEALLPYPLNVFAPLIEKTYEVNSAADLQIVLETIFSDKKTISAIQSLILQSKQ